MGQFEPERFGATLECGDSALALLFPVVFAAAIDVVLTPP
ncbi:hypothetical protein TVNIR_2835 [Thioalkalivibrio nitratireducens DSM 14787]|uniref:Uncharacterized protein n=1 Tax=Thioalkalivibrio nitratireducens (strain DSM 14787 / UNIQEM 213 / ALEN2) TaxID=1255043 RepID=L0DZQ2_THIND|nr:hypothetical protein TVNIR_2835 [Thioalkalivibrio nitratireducens DSM 14787]